MTETTLTNLTIEHEHIDGRRRITHMEWSNGTHTAVVDWIDGRYTLELRSPNAPTQYRHYGDSGRALTAIAQWVEQLQPVMDVEAGP